MSHNTLENYYKTIFNLVQEERFGTISEIESLMPFEVDLYKSMLKDKREIEEEHRKQQAAIQEALSRRAY